MIKNSHKYFTYYPPQTEKRKYLHNQNNDNCYNLFIKFQTIIEKEDKNIIIKLCDDLKKNNIVNIENFIYYEIQDNLSKNWAKDVLNYEIKSFIKSLEDYNLAYIFYNKRQLLEEIVKKIQILRMALNQGITVDELIGEKNEN